MQKEVLELIQKIGKFLQEHDTVRLQKLLKEVKKILLNFFRKS